MKVIAMYLPQFHRTKENDMWWGEGYTDWIAVQKAEPLFEHHDQPRIPLNENYYDLANKKTMEYQANLMQKYNVDGVCIYHYWFKDGRKVLEKPAENLLKWTHINMPYCFCWANETWARSWSNISEKNAWADLYETDKDKKGILLEQAYGDKGEWEKHFLYLLPFFLDKRYIKIEDKPVFVIYKSKQIEELDAMLLLWDRLAKENGLEGIYVIGSKTDYATRNAVDAELHMEPEKGMCSLTPLRDAKCSLLRYDDVWNQILCEIPVREETYFGGFVGFDDTPRRGENGLVVEGGTPEKFGGYLAKLMAKNEAYGMQILFLNAWNEWGEGMYLEPDQKNRFQYLEMIAYARKNYGAYVSYYKIQKENYSSKNIQILLNEKERNEIYFHLLNTWMSLKLKKVCLGQFLLQKGYKNIAVYGYGELGIYFINELRETGVTVAYVLDQKLEKEGAPFRIYGVNETLPEVDAIVITAVYSIFEIRKKLMDNGICAPLISLKRIIEETAKM